MAVRDVVQAAAGVGGGAGDLAAAIDFDGTNDYLSRSSDMTGNVNSKTFTFSCWIYPGSGAGSDVIYASSTSYFDHNNSEGVDVVLRNTSNGTVLLASLPSNSVPVDTFSHFLISVDLSNTSNRYVYVNDVNITSGVAWSTYTNQEIDWTDTPHQIGAEGGGNKLIGRLSNVFLDYTYRDLSVTNNRRLFITEDGKPADGQASLNPIMYMPLDDPEDIGYNAGTGGDFTVNGVMARSGRGPNQYNAAASTFDGSADYLSRSSSLSGSTASKTLSGSVNLKFNSGVTNTPVIDITDSSNVNGNGRMYFRVLNGELNVFGSNASGTTILSISTSGAGLVSNKFYNISFSVNLANAAQRFLAIDGVNQSLSVTTYTDDSVDIASNRQSVGGFAAGSSLWGGEMSDLYLDDSYIDLSSDNPFYDTETNKPKYLGESGELPTGSSPLVYLPLQANDAGNNLGTGGDFTVNSGPFTGARGPSEFIGRSAFKATDSGNYFNYGGPITDSSTTTVSGFVMMTGTPDTDQLGYILTSGNTVQLNTTYNDVSKIRLKVTPDGSGGNFVMDVDAYIPAEWNAIFFSCDTSGNLYLRVNSTENSGVSRSGNINLQSESDFYVMSFTNTAPYYGAKNIASLYFTTSYIDFTQESNRLLFLDGLGYPTNIQQAIDDSVIPTPLIYMPFDNVSALYTNNGTAGNFTQVGTITAGPDVGS